jgi:hypothetical protein
MRGPFIISCSSANRGTVVSNMKHGVLGIVVSSMRRGLPDTFVSNMKHGVLGIVVSNMRHGLPDHNKNNTVSQISWNQHPRIG